MAEPMKQQMGDGQDNYGQAAKEMAKAGKEFGKEAGKTVAKEAARQGAEATANAAASTVKAGVETGKAVSEIAAGTASGGPWGAIIAAAWAMRHTLFKILVSITIFLLIIIIAILSIPSIIFDTIFGRKFTGNENQTAIVQAYDALSSTVDTVIDLAFELTLGRVDDIITGGGYNYSMSMNHLTYQRPTSADYDTYYIIAAYSASMGQAGTSPEHFESLLKSASNLMFPISYTVKKAERIVETLLGPITEIFEYVVCKILPFDIDAILNVFGLDLDAQYGEFNITYGEAIDYMAGALQMTLEKGV
jgi:hypothetical protein